MNRYLFRIKYQTTYYLELNYCHYGFFFHFFKYEYKLVYYRIECLKNSGTMGIEPEHNHPGV